MDNAALTQWLSSLLTLGKVSEVDTSKHLYRVEFDTPDGTQKSGWIYALSTRAGDDVETWFYDVGEQVLVAALTPMMETGVILGALNQSSYPPASNSQDLYKKTFKDGTAISYDRSSSVFTLDAAGDVSLVINGNAVIDVTGTADISAGTEVNVESPVIKLNDGAGVVTGESVCQLTGKPHAHCSTTVFAGM